MINRPFLAVNLGLAVGVTNLSIGGLLTPSVGIAASFSKPQSWNTNLEATWLIADEHIPAFYGSQQPLIPSSITAAFRLDVLPENWIFNVPPPPDDIGAPGRRASGGSRSCGDTADAGAVRLTALVPIYDPDRQAIVYGTTVSAQPRLWFYLPQVSSVTATLTLRNGAGDRLFETAIALPDTAGIISISLASTPIRLQPNQPYRWILGLYCGDPPPIAFVEGWIQRVELSDLQPQIWRELAPAERIQYYTSNGIWHDALAIAADLPQSDPADESWQTLLRSIDLGHLTAEPRLPCCDPVP